MINIIEHIWQSELKNYEIMPTVVKITKNTPKSYFFSSKQSKVLRKKDQTVQSAMDILQVSSNLEHQFLMIKIIAPTTVQYNLILSCQVSQHLDDSEHNFAVIGLKYKQINNLIYYTFESGKKECEANIIMNLCKINKIWLSPEQEQFMPAQNKQLLHKFCLNFIKQLLTQLKLTNCKLAKLELIVSSNRFFDQFLIVWCNKLIFTEKNFYQINYKLAPKVNVFPKEQEIKNNLKQGQGDYNKSKYMAQQTKQIKQIQQVGIQCWGCGNSLKLEQSKEISNQQVMILRRRHGLSIMGIFNQYLNVCLCCYQSSEE